MTQDYQHTPEARESEKALLGAILIDPTILDRVSLEADRFYDQGNRTIYQTMRAIGSRELDLVVLSEALDRKGKMAEIGGMAYLLQLPQATPHTYNFETYERIIRDTAIRRGVIQSASELAKSAYNENADITDAISKAVTELVQSAKPKGGAISMKEFLSELYEEISDRAENPKVVHGLETGLKDFDKITHGLQKGEEFILAGQPGTGKSLLAFQLGCGMAANGHAGAVYALEMSGKAMVRRRLSAITKIPTYNMQSGVDMNARWDKLNKGVEELEPLPIYISDATDWTTLQLRADLSRLKQQNGCEWFILDYLDLLVDNVGKDRNEKSEYLSRQIHGICKDLDIAGLVIQSLNKGGYGGTPRMSHLSGSAKISYDADSIAILSQDENTENIVNLIWEKQREADGNRALKLVKVAGFPAFGEMVKEPNGIRDWTK
jgi:replicative DNA helicase